MRLIAAAVLALAGFAPQNAAVSEWIWASAKAADGERAAFRKAFEAKGVASASLVVTCDNGFTAWVNGQEVARGDEWSKPVRADVKKHLRDGRNVIAIEGRNADGVAALLARLEWATETRRTTTIVTDPSWEVSLKPAEGWQKPDASTEGWSKAVSLGNHGRPPWGVVLGKKGAEPEAQATGVDKIQVRDGFKIELLYSVPKAVQGSWVGLGLDGKGRLIASDQGNLGLYRITVDGAKVDVEKIDVPVSGAQGLCWAFGALYANVNGKGAGLWRITDTDGDDRLDKAEHVMPLNGGGEHGPHAVIPTEDGKALYVVGGNHTAPPDGLTGSRLSTAWSEDLLLPRQWDAKGHARGIMAPGGWVARVSPDGLSREIVSVGYRNQYDVAINRHGEMFTFDADMEWDLGMPWYRPTRVNHVVSGSEFGWRSGTGKWPAYYADSLPAVVDIGPGSPTGVVAGLGAKFPAKWQDAIYLLDWTYGTIWAVHLKPQGASYTADVEEFAAGAPFPVTDAVIGADGAMYVTVGGRGTQSGLYRITYVGSESTAPPPPAPDAGAEARAKRRALEAFHGKADPKALDAAWPFLGDSDRFLRSAARLAVEAQPAAQWQARALSEPNPHGRITAAVALARTGPKDAFEPLLKALHGIDYARLSPEGRLDLLRAYQLAFIRMGPGTAEPRKAAAARLDALYPAGTDDENAELAQLLVYLEAPGAVAKTLALMDSAKPSPMPKWPTVIERNRGYGGAVQSTYRTAPPLQKLHYAFVLRNARTGWTLDQRRAYFGVLADILQNHAGGASYQGFVQNIKKDAVANCSPDERRDLGALVADVPRKIVKVESLPSPKGPGKTWTMAELVPKLDLAKRNFDNGKRTFSSAKCIVCHRFDGDGGDSGPDLTGVAGRFTPRDLLESVVEPSKVVSDQYQGTILRTKDGTVLTGRLLGEKDGKLLLATDLLKADEVTEVAKTSVDGMKPSELSPMPDKLLDLCNEDEVLDLLAYLLSAGNKRHPLFR